MESNRSSDGLASAPIRGNVVVSFRQVSKNYKNSTSALDGLTFDVGEGTRTALLGPNGAGKTTAFNILVGLTPLSSGSVDLFGRAVSYTSDQPRRDVGYVGQDVCLDSMGSVRDNLRLQAGLYGLDRTTRDRQLEMLIAAFELGPMLKRTVMTLSGGEKRRIDIAMALVHGPKLLILDEPSANLDVDTVRQVWSHLESIHKEQKFTLLFSTHRLNEADSFATNIAFINRGRLAAWGSPTELKAMVGGDSVTVVCESESDAAKGSVALDSAHIGREAKVWGKEIFVVVQNAAQEIPRISNVLRDHDVSSVEIQMKKPSLDDVYTLLTGENYEESNTSGRAPKKPGGNRWWGR